MMALTQGGRLDYFGQNVELALDVAITSQPGTVALTQAVCQDVNVAERVQLLAHDATMHSLPGGSWVMSVTPPRT